MSENIDTVKQYGFDLKSFSNRVTNNTIYYNSTKPESNKIIYGVSLKAYGYGEVNIYKINAENPTSASTTLIKTITVDSETVVNVKFATPIVLSNNEYIGISGKCYYEYIIGNIMYSVVNKDYISNNFAISLNYIIQNVDVVLPKESSAQSKYFLEVAQDGSKPYITINSAYEAAIKVCSKEKPVTILIYPGVYEEYVNVLGKQYLSFIGVDKKRVIWRYDDANYQHAPLRIAGNCYVKDITFISTAKKYISDIDQSQGFEAWKRDNLNNHFPPDYSTWLGKLGSYAVHCDDEHNDDGELVTSTFENCIMYSETMPAFGAGLWPSYKIELIRCDLIGNYDKDFYDHANLEGALYVHGLQNGQVSGSYKEHLLMKNCTVNCNYKRVATFQKVASNTEDLDYLFYYNIFESEDLNDVSLITLDGVTVNNKSYGNNTSILNG